MKDDNGRPLTRAQEIMRLAIRPEPGRPYREWRTSRTSVRRAVPGLSYMGEGERDAVNHPSHYTSHPSGVECIQVTEHMNFNLGNAVKYLWRAGLKDSDKTVQDLQKARFYIDREIARSK
ncbi:DUF3310 domain-containing protein [Streptomyces sp. NPDC048057]|uniref:DUF3310 domain-containing protein n=1 Tax=Streptomyces sp. NPDC048057 TaxID=3155628 RepID=UPI0033E002CA